MRATAKVTGADLPGLTAKIRELRQLAGVQIETGIVGNDIDPGPADGPTLVEIGTTLEYGSPKKSIPARPWMRESVDRYAKKWARDFAKIPKLVTSGQIEKVDAGLRIIGLEMVGDVTQTLYDGPWEPNADFTVRQQWEKAGRPGTLDAYRASKKPLIDTGQLVQSHRSQIIDMQGNVTTERGARQVIG